MRAARSVLLAVLVVAASVVGSAPALAQTTETATDSGPVTKTFETGPHKVEIDLFDVSSQTTITVITDESPAGNNTAILKKDVSGSQNSAHFRNAGAYESFTIRVEGADGPVSFSKGGPTNAWTPGDDGKFLGDTGGDPGFTYDLSEQIGESVMPQVVQLDRTGLPDSTTVNTTGTDAQQTKLDIYQSAQNSKSQATNYHTTMDNYLSDTKTQARIIGKNAYIKALNNGSSKAAAKTEAKTAVADYYAVKQENLASEWDAELANHQYLKETAATEGIQEGSNDVNEFVSFSEDGASLSDSKHAYLQSYPTESLTLVNSSSVTVSQYHIQLEGASSTYSGSYSLTTGDGKTVSSGDANEVTVTSLAVAAPNSNYDPLMVADFSRYASQWSEIESQNTQVQNDMDTLAENTYSAYQSGEINSSDLVDPYVLASQQSAGSDFQGWAAAQLTLTGTNSPENFDQIGSFNITTSDGTQHEGVLFSQENPTSGQFEAGQQYDASTLGGTQYVVTSDQIVELTGTFTVDDITDQNGETVQNVTVQKTQYQTTNTTELKQLYEDLAYERAQIEAREQALAGGGGFNLGGQSGPVVIVAVAGAALILLKD